MKRIESMDTPSTREEFEHRFHVLNEKKRTGKFHNPFTAGLNQVRLLPNGRIDILSINEQARLQANTMSQFDTKRIQELIKEQDEENQTD
jgi:hypothetical protein